jgi:uncharacterized protein YdiU (UPF0061 family)
MEQENLHLKQQIEVLTQHIHQLEEHLKKYTNSTRHLKYYENNKDTVKERTKNYVHNLKENNPEKLREWRRNYYLKKKEQRQQDNQVNS